MLIYAVLIAAMLGLTIRIVWAKTVAHGIVYRVPIFWVLLVIGIAGVLEPRSIVFCTGLFVLDLIAWAIKGEKEEEEKLKNAVNWLISKIPVKNKKEDLNEN